MRSGRKIDCREVGLHYGNSSFSFPIQWVRNAGPRFFGAAVALLLQASLSVHGQTPGTKLWEFVTKGSVLSSPAIGADGVIYFGSSDKRLYALDGSTGLQRWSYLANAEVHNSPVLDENGRLFFATKAGLLIGLRATDGAQLWTYQMAPGDNSGPINCALGPGPLLYAACKPGYVYGMNRTNGVMVWSAKLPGAIGESPVVGSDGAVYIGCDDYSLYALDGVTGRRRWRFPIDHEVRVSPAFAADGTLYFFSYFGPLYALDPRTGTQKWKSTATVNLRASSPAIGANAWIYSGSFEPRFQAFDPVSRSLKWSVPVGDWVTFSSPAVGDDGVVYGASKDKKVYAFDGATGAKKWEFLTGGVIQASPAIGSWGVVYIGSDDGKLYALAASSRGLAASSWPKYRGNARQTGAQPFRPVLAEAPHDTVVLAGQPVTVRVVAYGEPPLSFQWFKDGAALADQTGAEVSVVAAGDGDTGVYTVRVTNPIAVVESMPALIRVADHLPPDVVSLTPAPGATTVLPNTAISAEVKSRATVVDPGSVRLSMNGQDVSTQLTLTPTAQGVVIRYQPPLLERNTVYDLTLVYGDIHPNPLLQTNRWQFTSADIPTITADRRVAFDTNGTTRGFNIRSAQMPDGPLMQNDLVGAERLLAQPPGVTIAYRGAAKLPVLNLAKSGNEFYGMFKAENGYSDTSFINAKLQSGNGSFAIEARGYIELTQGVHRFGTICDDGFEFCILPATSEQLKLVLGSPWGSGSNERQFDVYVAEDGIYPFRYIFWEWAVAAYVEFFTVDMTTGKRTLINDPQSASAFKTYYVGSGPDAQTQNLTVTEDTPLNIVLQGSVPDGSTPRFRVVQSPTLGRLSGTAPNLTYTPSRDTTSQDSFRFQVTDLLGNFAEGQVNLTIQPVNDPPVLPALANRSARADAVVGPITFSVQDVDSPLDQIVVSATSTNPSIIPHENIHVRNGATAGERLLELTAATGAVGTAEIVLTADDGQGGMASTRFQVSFTPLPPVLLTGLTNQTLRVGASLVMSVEVGGTPPFSYEWRFNGVLITDVTGPVLSRAVFQQDQAGRYSVSVRNGAGEVSASASISAAGEPPKITVQPESLAAKAGESATFSVTANGTAPLSYQWFFNGNAILEATLPSLTLSSLANASAGTYWVTVTNSLGAVISDEATLQVLSPHAPSVVVRYPAPGAQFVAPATVPLLATALDADGYVTNVTFLDARSAEIGRATSEPFRFDWPSLPVGDYTVAARAMDNTGLASTSAPVRFQVIVAPQDLPAVSVGDVQLPEGSGGTVTKFSFQLRLSAPSVQEVSVVCATADGTAKAGSDYEAVRETVRFAPGQTTATFVAPVLGDDDRESQDESFFVNLVSATNAVLGDAQGEGLIYNDEPPITAALEPAVVEVSEGDIGSPASVRVALSEPSSVDVRVFYKTEDGTARSGQDFEPVSGVLVIPAGAIQGTITWPILDDTETEPSPEVFYLDLTGVANAILANARSEVRIRDNDLLPNVTAGPLTVAEGQGSWVLTVPVRLDSPAPRSVKLSYKTVDGTAQGGEDFEAAQGAITIPAGARDSSIPLTILGDHHDEPDEAFYVEFTGSDNAVLATNRITITLRNEDLPVSLTANSVTVPEGNSPGRVIEIPVRLSEVSGRTVRVQYQTMDGSAGARSDYRSASGNLEFLPGTNEQVIRVTVDGDTLDEADESFTLRLSNQENATLSMSDVLVTLTNDDLPPTLTLGPRFVTEGNEGVTRTNVLLLLSSESGREITVGYTTVDGTARVGEDYRASGGTLVIPPGVRSTNLVVEVLGDLVDEPSETFLLRISNAVNVVVAQGESTITIFDDDEPRINRPPLVELSQPSGGAIFRQADLIHIQATATDSDGTIAKVEFYADSTKLGQSMAAPYALDWTQANPGAHALTVIATDNDGATNISAVVQVGVAAPSCGGVPSGNWVNVSLADAPLLNEGQSGSSNAVFTVTLSAASTQVVTVEYGTLDVTAEGGKDYTPTRGLLSFTPGQTRQTITVPVLGDLYFETNETFRVQIYNPANAFLNRCDATGTIINDDALPQVSISDVEVLEVNGVPVAAEFAVTLSAPSEHEVTVSYATADGTAAAPGDYQTASGSLSFRGWTLNAPASAAPTGSSTAPRLSISRQPNGLQLSWPRNVPGFTVQSLDRFSAVCNWATMTEPPEESGDEYRLNVGSVLPTRYYRLASSVSFGPGETNKTITIWVNGDSVYESNETFFVGLTNPVNATLAKARGVATIRNDDTAPVLGIDDVTVDEGNGGIAPAVFKISLVGATQLPVTVYYATADGTGVAGIDYQATSDVLTFNSGEDSKTITVGVNGNTVKQTDRTFLVNLSAPTQASIGRGQGTAMIRDDDTFNEPPTVRMTSPENNATFLPGSDVILSAEPVDPDGTVVRVDFFAGATLIASATRAPWTVTWSKVAGVGDFQLTAKATDNLGATAHSAPVLIHVAHVVADVAIIRNFSDPEIDVIERYLFDLGLTSFVLGRESVTWEALQGCKLIIWDDLGKVEDGLRDVDVTLLQRAYDAQIPLYLIGERLAASAANLSPAAQLQWNGLTHLRPTSTQAGDGTVHVLTDSNHRVINGRFGAVFDFAYPARLEQSSQIGTDQVLLGQSGAADVLLANEDPSSGVRTVIQNFLVVNGSGDSESISERERLFMNAVWWLLRKPLCGLTDLTISERASANPAATGTELVFTLVAQRAGECEATGVVVTDALPANVKFVSAETSQGTWTEADNVVTFHLGLLEEIYLELKVTVIPLQPGPLVNQVRIRGNEREVSVGNNASSLTVQVTGTPFSP